MVWVIQSRAGWWGSADREAVAQGPSYSQPAHSHMLIDEDWVPVRVHGDEAGRSRGTLIRFLLKLHPQCLQLALEIADIGERGEWLGLAVPAGVEGENVFLEHPLEKPDYTVTVPQNQPILRCFPEEGPET